MSLTDADLDRVEQRAASTLAAPWLAYVEGRDHESGDSFIRTGDNGPDLYVSEESATASSRLLDFIANARQDVPVLAAEVRRLRTLLSAS
jgi:hypothetical protein